MLLRSQKSGHFLDVFRINHLMVSRTINSKDEEALETLQVNVGLFLPPRHGEASNSQNIQLDELGRDLSLIVEHGPFQNLDLLVEALANFILSQNFGTNHRLMCEAVEIEILQSKGKDDSFGSVHIHRESQEALRHDRASTWDMIFTRDGTALFRGVVEPCVCLRPWLPGWTLNAIWTTDQGLKADDREIKSREILKLKDVHKVLLSHEGEESKSFFALAHRQQAVASGAPALRALGRIMQKDL